MSGLALIPAQLQSLRDALPPFGSGEKPPPLVKDFCRCYGIDFLDQYPDAQHTVGTIASGEFQLAAHRWTRPGARANLLLVHGYLDHVGLFGKLIGWGLSRGCNILAFDLPGHGLSTGEPAVIDDFADYSRAIADVLAGVELPGLPLWVMAQSTGGAALFDYAGKYHWPFAGTVLLAPLVRPAGWAAVRAGELLLGRFIDSVPRKFTPNSSDRDFLDFVKADPLQSHRLSLRWVGALRRWLNTLEHRDLGVGPALIIQGEADHTVDWRYNVDVVCRLLPGSRVFYLQEAGHHLANESGAFRDAYLGQVAAWLAGRGVDLPDRSGIEAG